MLSFRNFNNSFVHGVAAYSACLMAPLVQSSVSMALAFGICVYAGWCRQAYLASFLGGVIVSVVGWTAAGILTSPEVGSGMYFIFMVPFALSVMLPEALAGYVIGKIVSKITHRRDKVVESEP